MIKTSFDDYKNLLKYDFSDYKYIIFYWKSWAGKSSYINELKLKNKSLKKEDIIIVDEILDFFSLLKNFKSLFKAKKYLICSHLNKYYFLVFSLFWKLKFINLDKSENKIYNYLDNKNIKYSKSLVKEFIKKYKSNYTDLDIILEKYNWNDFDKAFRKFKKFNNLKITLNKNYGKKK